MSKLRVLKPRPLEYDAPVYISTEALEGFTQDCESLQKLFGEGEVTILGIQGYPEEFYTELGTDNPGSYLVIFFRVDNVTYQFGQQYIFHRMLNEGRTVHSYRFGIYRPRKKSDRNPYGQAVQMFFRNVDGKSGQYMIFPEGVHAFPLAKLLQSDAAVQNLHQTIAGFTEECVAKNGRTATAEFANDVLSALRRKPGFWVVEFDN